MQERKPRSSATLARLRGQEKSLLGEVERLELEVRLRSEELRETQLVLQRDERADGRDRCGGVRDAGGVPRRRRGRVLAARARALYKLGELSYLRLLLSVDRPVGHASAATGS